jgi:hypothetical protein
MRGIILSQKQEQLLIEQHKCAATKRILIVNYEDDVNFYTKTSSRERRDKRSR